MTRVVTAGETMALLDPEQEGELEGPRALVLDVARRARAAGALGTAGLPRAIVRTTGGAMVEGIEVPFPRCETVIDEVGAGDAFAAGFAYGLLRGRTPRAAVESAHAVAAWALRGTGDWETLPRLRDVFPDG